MDRPSIQRAAACGLISIPWTRQPVSLGLGFDSQITDPKADPFQWSNCAFDNPQLKESKIVYHRFDNCRGTYLSAATTRSTSSIEHLSLSLGVTVGNDLLGASVTGSYDKSVLDNKAVSVYANWFMLHDLMFSVEQDFTSSRNQYWHTSLFSKPSAFKGSCGPPDFSYRRLRCIS